MAKNLLLKISILLLLIGLVIHNPALAAGNSSADLKNAEASVDQAIDYASKGDLAEAQKAFDQFNKTWRQIETGIKNDSATAYKDIESNMGQVDYSLTIKKPDQVLQALQGLKAVNEKFINGGYPKDTGFKKKDISLDDFILMLQKTKEQVGQHNQSQALESIKKASDSWLSVEGTVVAQSSTVYNDSERDLVSIQAMLSADPPNYQQAEKTIDNMVKYLSPLADKSQYTYWDAAMILIREGLEALLVVIALMSFVKKSGEGKGKGWIWTGVLAGLGVSVILAIIVKFVISSGAFGNNNFLISGWTGVFAAVMLLYMSYWLHSQSNIADWNRYIKEKSQTALSTGRLVSLGILAFLAVFREGTETVLFYIGMASQIKIQTLLIGFLIGVAILGIIAYLMVFVGLKLPLRPFFMVSSVIVFYLCIKFTGMGIHSLQLAGLIPTTNAEGVPSIDFFALYPSWESTIPQIILVLGAVILLITNSIKKKKMIAAHNN
ncbi:FTR1 family iron permease [Neobacillus massiliamazoniensis]|uniref:Iron permease, FTR1 family n=1 Tax=Neobacillus massiliamazoniensis TaxID=1499688 RepID=A0A0U1NTX5_9BACI|nr:FTR1 family protein [Neobacillus massiliamazoniensis]CRK81511.1 iron permease, FTR1 family [Neobacillus massiliamazoniensis]